MRIYQSFGNIRYIKKPEDLSVDSLGICHILTDPRAGIVCIAAFFCGAVCSTQAININF